jgi:dipeptidyl aminopeptidase/acylaminoacyl peptidase
MSRRSLWVCLLALSAPNSLAAQQETEAPFDATPVAVPQSHAGSPRPVTSKDLLSLRETHGVRISPDGEWIAFVVGQATYETNSYRSGLFVVRTSGEGPPVCLGSAGMPHWSSINEWIDEQPQWSNDSRLIYYRTRMRQAEFWQLWQWNREGGGAKPLTHVPGDVAAYELDSAGQKIVMGVELPPGPNTEKQLLEEGIRYTEQTIPWEGMPSILRNLRSAARKSEFWVHELKTEIERQATEVERQSIEPDVGEFQMTFDKTVQGGTEKCHIDNVTLAPDKKNAVLSCSYDEADPSGIMRWKSFLMARDGHRRLELAPDSMRVTDYWWNRDGHHLYFVSTQGDGRPGRMRVFDVESGRVRDFFYPTEVLHGCSIDAADRFIACTGETNVSPPELRMIDQRAGVVRTLVDLNPEFRDIQLSAVERISGVNRYGEEWFGQLVKPFGYEKGKRYPLIVTLYRSGDYFLVGAVGNENPIQVYAAHGFVVLSFNIGRNRLRKNGDFDDYLLNWASPTASLEMAVRSLVETGLVDPQKVGLAGLSRGAEILEYAISHSHIFQAAVESGPGARDPFFYYMAGRNWHGIFAKWGLGGWPDGESKKNWEKLAASLNADRIETPLLMNSPDSEFLGNMALYTSLEQLHKPVDLYVYTNELHIKNQPKHRYGIYERNIDWFRFWLQGEKDASLEKKDQYSRWEHLRETWMQRQGQPWQH